MRRIGSADARTVLRRVCLIALAALTLVGCSSGPNPRSSSESERADALMQTMEELGFAPTRKAAIRNAPQMCDQIADGPRTREEFAQFRAELNDIDGDAWVDASALYACPEHYTE